MTLSTGTKLNHYEISSQLGKGGMGEVYRAKDQKLGRDVAIKVLPEEFAKDADRVARFQREAKLLASLNHPNIAAIYGLEESNGITFLVLELIQGDTLADRLKRGPIPVEESLKLALQITEALEAAHEKGVIHRDLKPANIKVTPDGKVKVLDFGLAKAFIGERGEMILSDSPTLSLTATQQGVILGTAAYMSPEQAKGKAVDKRADIWAFGVVLYEMLTGQAAFQGEDASEILASVIKGDANLKFLSKNIHPRVHEMLMRCLKKTLKERYRDIGDAQFEIRQALADPGGAIEAAVETASPQPVFKSRHVGRFVHHIPEDQHLVLSASPTLAISADGSRFVYNTGEGLCLRSLNQLQVRLLSVATENPTWPFFSPDSQWLGYLSQIDNKLKKIAVAGGSPITLCDTGTILGASWGADNTVIYTEAGKGILRVSANGGNPEMLVEAEDETFFHPRFLPDGKSILFTIGGVLEDYKVAVLSLKSGERKVLFAGDCACYLPTGHIVYTLENTLYAVPFDPDRIEITGGSVPVVERVFRSALSTAPHYAVSASGTLVYLPDKTGTVPIAQRTLVWVDKNGKEDAIEVPPQAYSFPKISRDGTRVALTVGSGKNANLWIFDFASENLTKLTFDSHVNICPIWTSDGKRITFFSGGVAKPGVYWKSADGTGQVESIISGGWNQLMFPSFWTGTNEKTLVLCNVPGIDSMSVAAAFSVESTLVIPILTDLQSVIEVLELEDDQRVQPLLKGKNRDPKLSPDGRWMAYVSRDSGRDEVYVRPFPDVDNGLWQVGAGDTPIWAPQGQELFYRTGDAFMAAEVKTEPSFRPGKSRVLFRGSYIVGPGWGNAWDIHPDGERFLMMKEHTGETSTKKVSRPTINIVVNWFEELRDRVPVK